MAKALINFAFEVLNAEKIQAHCDSRNHASEKVMIKIGMTLVDDSGTRYYPKIGISSGEYLYAIIVRSWYLPMIWTLSCLRERT